MATFAQLLEDKALIKVGVRLLRDQFPERKLYAYPDCWHWIRGEVPKLKSGVVQSAFTPNEQQTYRFRQWIAGLPMEKDRMFHDMRPREAGVWELKTADLRYFGWMYRKRELIIARCRYADDLKGDDEKQKYDAERDEVIARRDSLPLDGEKWKEGSFDDLV